MKLVKTNIDLLHVKKGDEVIFLGTWCLNRNEDFLKERNESHIIPYHWNNRNKFYEDYNYLSELYEKKLLSLTATLNNIHNVQKDTHYWRIVIGPWLRFSLDALFDRYESIKLSKNHHNDLIYSISSYNLNDWYARDFSDLWEDFTTDEWNEVIFSECIKHQKIDHKISNLSCIMPKRDIENEKGFHINFKRFIRTYLSNIFLSISRFKKGIIFYKPYIKISKLLRINIRLKQIPFFWEILKDDIEESNINRSHRNLFIKTSHQNSFEDFFDNLIPYLMPKSYLEDYIKLTYNISKKMPTQPKSIFTANAYQADDIFKIWAAEQKDLGVPLIIGQHGGQFGITKFNQTIDHQLLISSKFITWGWTEDLNDNVIPMPSMQLSGNNSIKSTKDGDILCVLSSHPPYFYCHQSLPVSEQFLSYIEDQFEFINHLDSSNAKILKIRLDSSAPARWWNLSRLFFLRGLDSSIDRSEDQLWDVIKKSRICISTNNTTVFLETLSRNFPTIVFWDPIFNEINEDAEEYINLLFEAGILFYNPCDAAKKINAVVDNIDEWWFSEEVQVARETFCDRYALTCKSWPKEWSNFLNKD